MTYTDERGFSFEWPGCNVTGCLNGQCLTLSSPYCYPHTHSYINAGQLTTSQTREALRGARLMIGRTLNALKRMKANPEMHTTSDREDACGSLGMYMCVRRDILRRYSTLRRLRVKQLELPLFRTIRLTTTESKSKLWREYPAKTTTPPPPPPRKDYWAVLLSST